MSTTTEFWGLLPGGELPDSALAQLDTARMEVVAAGRPDIPSTTPYTSAQLNAMPVGSVYRSTDGPQGAWEWRKRGATTWVCEVGDTGYRIITDTLPGVASSTPSVARRVAHQVTVAIYRQAVDMPATSGTIWDVPSGFGVGTRAIFGAATSANASHGFRVTTSTTGASTYIQSLSALTSTTAGLSVQYPTVEPWPTALPGTAA